MDIKSKIFGMTYGAVVASALGRRYNGTQTHDGIYDLSPYDVEYDDVGDWRDDIDMSMLIIDNLTDWELNINQLELALSFKYWQKNGIMELGNDRIASINEEVNFILSQTSYVINPVKSSKQSYKIMSYERCSNGAIMRNFVCGVTKNWYQNTIKHCILTHYDTRCIASCLVQSYIVNCIFVGKPIVWNYIYGVCMRVISHGYKKSRNAAEFEKYWHIALHYKKLRRTYDAIRDDDEASKESCFLNFLKRLNIGNYDLNENQANTLLPMTILIATMVDIQYIVETTSRRPDVWYFIERIKEIVSVGGIANVNASVVGTVLGLYIGVDAVPKEWIGNIKRMDWIDIKLKNFLG